MAYGLPNHLRFNHVMTDGLVGSNKNDSQEGKIKEFTKEKSGRSHGAVKPRGDYDFLTAFLAIFFAVFLLAGFFFSSFFSASLQALSALFFLTIFFATALFAAFLAIFLRVFFLMVFFAIDRPLEWIYPLDSVRMIHYNFFRRTFRFDRSVTTNFNQCFVTILLEPISKIPMGGNGSDFVFSRGGSTQVWLKPHQGEPTKRGCKSAPPAGWHPKGTLTSLKMLDDALASPCAFLLVITPFGCHSRPWGFLRWVLLTSR